MLKKLFHASLAISLCFIVGTISAETRLPSSYPANFDVKGTVTNIDYKRRIIHIDYASYSVALTHTIYTLEKKNKLALFQLKKGIKVGASLSASDEKTITNLWILPKKLEIKPQAR